MNAHATRYVSAALVAALSLAACGGDDQVEATNDAVSAGVDSMVAGSELAKPAMTDANIVAALSVANAGEVAAGELAGSQARDADVKAFGRMMVTDHRAMIQETDRVATAAGIVAAQGPTTDSIQRAATATTEALKPLQGADFDRAYIASQVRDHQNTLRALQHFADAAQNAELKAMIQGAMPKVQQHLDRATEIQGRLGSTASTATSGAGTGGR
jgi:putative membrane protein